MYAITNMNEAEKKERQRLAQQRYRLKHPNKEKEYRLNNAKKEAERHKLYQSKNKNKIKEYHKEYRLKNKDKIKERGKDWYINNREAIIKRTALRNKNNRESLKVIKAYHRYKITPKEYFKFMDKQNSKCVLCGCDLYPWDTNTNIDHDHKTNKVRGLLCSDCNKGIGLLKEDIDILERAIKYLKENS